MADSIGERSGLEIGREHRSRRPTAIGCCSTARVRDELRAEEYRAHSGGPGISAQSEHEKHFAAGRPDASRRNKSAFHLRWRPGLQRAARSRAGSGQKDAARLGRSAKESAGSGASWLSRGRNIDNQPVARALGALFGIVGRRAHLGWRVFIDPTDDPAAFRWVERNRNHEWAPWPAESRRTRTRSRNFSRDQTSR